MSGTATLAPRPAHIPQAAVFDYDIFNDEALLRDPHARILTLNAEAPPFFWTPHNNGHWMALRHADVFRIMREPDTFSSSPMSPEKMAMMAKMMPEGFPRIPGLTPILMDPPDHTKYRAPLQRAFSPKLMMQLKPQIEAFAVELIDGIKDKGHCDFFAEVSEQYPVRVFLRMMGLPEERLVEFRSLVREVFQPAPNPMEQGLRIRRIADAMMAEILDRRENPREDLLSMLWTLEIDGAPIGLELVEDYASLLFLAGLDTVINGISFGIRHLAMNPDLQDAMRGNEDLIVETTEELLRRYTFTVGQRRLTRDAEVAGHSLKEGDMVVVYLPAADLDAQEFADPAKFEPTREDKAHLAFGAGPHRCLGSHLARIELQTLYRVVLDRLPKFRLDPDTPVRFHAGMMLTMDTLPIRWD